MTVRKDDPEELWPLEIEPVSDPRREASSLAGRLLTHVRRPRRPRWWEEVLFIGVSYFLYSTVRNAVPSHSVSAFHRAHAVLRFEHDTHLDIERSLNKVVASSHLLAYASSYWYAAMHFVVTIGVLVWLYIRHPLRYRPIRTVLYTANILALIGFWFYALAPPRMLTGFVDTVDIYPTAWGSWNTAGVAKLSNQLAAMPSLHIGWSTWCGLVIVHLARHRITKILGIAYPLVTLFVILGTANHFLVDAVGGLLVLAASFTIERLIFGRGAFDDPIALMHARSRRGQS